MMFNMSSISAKNGNSNLNNSFDTFLSKNHHTEFNIPNMLPRRNQNINSSVQSKFTLESVNEEP